MYFWRCIMRLSRILAIILLLLSGMFAAGKGKKKIILPADVLQAKTVLVIIDPDAGIAVDTPNANLTARDDVEKALMKWGRFDMATDVSTADLVITVHKGSGKTVEPTIGGIPQNNRPVIFQPTESGVRVGGSHGTPPMAGDPSQPQSPGPGPQVEVGGAQDTLAVYRGKREDPLDSPSVWCYSAKDALKSPGVPAIDEFKKAITEAEKQQASNP
jgi:hypothetical protein